MKLLTNDMTPEEICSILSIGAVVVTYITPPAKRPIRPFTIEVITRSAIIFPSVIGSTTQSSKPPRIIYNEINLNDPGQGRRFWYHGPEPHDICPGNVQTIYIDGTSLNMGIFDSLEDLFEILPIDYMINNWPEISEFMELALSAVMSESR